MRWLDIDLLGSRLHLTHCSVGRGLGTEGLYASTVRRIRALQIPSRAQALCNGTGGIFIVVSELRTVLRGGSQSRLLGQPGHIQRLVQLGILATVGAAGQVDAALLLLPPTAAGIHAALLLEQEASALVASKADERFMRLRTTDIRNEEQKGVDEGGDQQEDGSQHTQGASKGVGIPGCQAICPGTCY